MKTTIDIPDKEMADIMRLSGAKTKREAVVAAIVDYNRRRKMADLIKYSGTFTGLMDNDKIEGMELDRMKSVYGPDFEYAVTAPAQSEVNEDG